MLVQMALFHSFSYKAEYYSIVCVCVCVCVFFIHSPVDGHVSFLHVLAIVNIAAMNIEVHVSFQIRVFFGYMPMSEIAG